MSVELFKKVFFLNGVAGVAGVTGVAGDAGSDELRSLASIQFWNDSINACLQTVLT